MGEGPVSGPFAESELRAKYHKVSLNSIGGGDQRSRKTGRRDIGRRNPRRRQPGDSLTTHPTRQSLADALRVMDVLKKPAESKRGGTSGRLRVITPETERGLVSIMGADDFFYANTVGTFGAVSTGQNWGRLASAVRRWALKLVDKQKVFLLLFSDEALSWRKMRSLGGPFLLIAFS